MKVEAIHRHFVGANDHLEAVPAPAMAQAVQQPAAAALIRSTGRAGLGAGTRGAVRLHSYDPCAHRRRKPRTTLSSKVHMPSPRVFSPMPT